MELLPIEIIKEIKYFYQLPEINIIQDNEGTGSNSYGIPQDFYLSINYQLITVDFRMFPKLGHNSLTNNYSYNIKHNEKLDQFINDLINNKECTYDESTSCWEESQTFEINFGDNAITINSGDAEAFLKIENKDQLIKALREYRTLLNSYAI